MDNEVPLYMIILYWLYTLSSLCGLQSTILLLQCLSKFHMSMLNVHTTATNPINFTYLQFT